MGVGRIVSKVFGAVFGLRIAPTGWTFVLGFSACGFLLVFLDRWFSLLAGTLLMAFGLFCVYFFRDPEPDPVALARPGAIIAPSHGKVMEIASVDGEGYGEGKVVRIFLSVLDAHTQRSPVAGRIKSVTYQPGVFLDARDERAPFVNEQNAILIESAYGPVMVKQIAGLLARRIVCWVRPGVDVRTGDLLGLIRFGSQVDLYVPPGVDLRVREGERVYCAKTVIGEAKQSSRVA